MSDARTFDCSICGEPSTQICVYCTKDACPNHLCCKCKRCSDCCECEVPLDSAQDAGQDTSSQQPAEKAV
ncbi:MAG TPA: hypothetical protein PLA43_08190 [Bryobacteraceae bacterium]|nr:hypothetical protein [Bryobacteraceae bacterium]HOL73747.1 hypothetical protein [Bryobacteraceae bacterium]HOQ44712.1 hypothetical protein [Bryobacteraceae bacterium]HPQ15069.1 hypothetical protein [Bryobacteraceae bacterium]HPU71922.1 hypothetical protein [Bryobacteraceae bacterium]